MKAVIKAIHVKARVIGSNVKGGRGNFRTYYIDFGDHSAMIEVHRSY